MNLSLLFWIYMINAILLINHEIDSAYWQEWKLVNNDDKHGIKGFLILHFPMLFAILFGLILIDREMLIGYLISMLLGASGVFAFFFHFYHLRKGRNEFNNWLSKSILIATLPVSVFQIVLSVIKILL